MTDISCGRRVQSLSDQPTRRSHARESIQCAWGKHDRANEEACNMIQSFLIDGRDWPIFIHNARKQLPYDTVFIGCDIASYTPYGTILSYIPYQRR